jgi:hypothetical protein
MGERRGEYMVWWGNLGEEDHFEGLGVDGRVILKRICQKCGGVMEWIDLARDRGKWRALVNAVINFRVS